MVYAVQTNLQYLKSPLVYDSCPIEIVKRILDNIDNLKSYDIVRFFEGWFCGAKISSIKLGNMREFASWVMFASHFRDLSAQNMEKVSIVISDISARLNVEFKEGFNPAISHVHMTLEPLHYIHRPLILYIIVGIKNILSDFSLQALGYQKLRHRNVTYWHHPAPSSGQDMKPTVFFHGITTGWAIYGLLIQSLSSDRAVFLFEMDAIKIHSLNFDMPTPEKYCEVVRQVLDRHNCHSVNVVGHSFGTITAGWFVRACPQYVSHLSLLDPVCLLLAHPEVAYNFLYRSPTSLVEWVIYLGASSEVTIANALRRNFWWYKNELWLEDVHSSIGVHVSLAGGDEVCNSVTVMEYVQNCRADREALRATSAAAEGEAGVADITACYRDGHSHAQVLLCAESLARVACNILSGQALHLKKTAA
jgi:pimeloyl-ACP methyl ester carboxylesterase